MAESHATQAPDAPLDVLGAESEGQIGYLLETALSEALPDSEVSSLPAFCGCCDVMVPCSALRSQEVPP